MKPTADNIFIEPIEKKVTSLIIPPKYKYRSKEFSSGKVIAIGKKVTKVDVGDEIAYHRDFGINIDLNNKKFVVIRPRHILAIV